MTRRGRIFLGASTAPRHLTLARANRHGLIAGATGAGKTATLQVLAEGFSDQGVPVFLADVKGDLAGLSSPARRMAILRRGPGPSALMLPRSLPCR